MRQRRQRARLATFWPTLLVGAAFTTLALAFSACGGGSDGGGRGFQEGKGFPGDSDYADNDVREYYVDNGLVDAPVPPGTVLPTTVSNENLLTENVANQGTPGTCATVTFAQMVYGADVAAGAPNPLLDSVQFSYLFARYFQSNGMGGEKGWPEDSGSFAYTNFVALTTPSYRQTYANGFLPADGEEGKVMHPTGVFFPFEDSPNLSDSDQIEMEKNGKATTNLESYWNDINLWQTLNTGPSTLTITIRRAAFSPTSLDVKAIVAAGKLVFFTMDADDSKNQFDDEESRLFRTGVLELPYTKGEKEGGHAMLIVGYDDSGYGKYDGAGAFKVRNSWGDNWGDNGFWYAPYSLIDGVAGAAEDNTFPLYYDEDFVYISSMSHN